MTIEVSQEQRTVQRDGEEVPVGARAFDVLSFLVSNADRVVSKEELLNHVWSGLMVEESNLTVQIAGLRKALGRQTIKTVPGIGYRFIPAKDVPTQTAQQTPKPALPVPSIPSLAVLPFANLTGSADRDYLVDGIVNEVITALSRVSSFFVISSTSSFTYKGRAVDLAEVGQELGVRYILEGSIQQSGDQIRIFTQLLEAESGHTIWQDRIDGLSTDIFELQDRVAEHVAAALEPKVIWAEAARARAKPTDNLEAYDLCLRATPLVLRQLSLDALQDGLALLNQAVALDPGYTYAKALICFAHTGAVAARWWTFEQGSAAFDLAREVLNEDPDDALSLAYAGHYLAYVGQFHHDGLTALKRAARINPNSGTVAMLLGWVQFYMDQSDEALINLERARRISPLHPQIGIITCGLGNVAMQKGDYEKATTLLETCLTEYPGFASAYFSLLGCYWKLGRKTETEKTAALIREKIPDFTISTFLKTRPQNNASYSDAIIGGLKESDFPD